MVRDLDQENPVWREFSRPRQSFELRAASKFTRNNTDSPPNWTNESFGRENMHRRRSPTIQRGA
jgi:hypothetical protein